MSTASEVAAQAYALAKKADHRALRQLLSDDATWQPAAKAKWSPCRNADQVVKTLLWRAGRGNRMRPGETIDLGSQAVIRLRGRRLERLGARGLLVVKLFQVVEIKDGKIVRMHDHAKLAEALAATGHER